MRRVDQNAVDIMRKIKDTGEKQFNEFFNNCLKEKKTSIYAVIKNKLSILTQPSQPKKPSSNMEIASLKKSFHLFSRLYIACQTRDGNLDEFFFHENNSYPPAISKIGGLMPRSKSTLLHCINVDNEVAADQMSMDCIIMDGAVLTNIIKPNGSSTFQEYSSQKFKKQLQRSIRVDVVWDVFIENSLNFSARQKRGKNFLN